MEKKEYGFAQGQNILSLAKYLVNKGVTSPLKLQKLLFFLRYEELKNQTTEGSYFAKNYNFEAWIYGPVNRQSYFILQDYFANQDEAEKVWLSDKEMQLIDQKYESYFLKWNRYTTNKLVKKSHKNKAWLKARKDLDPNEICFEPLDELTPDFLEMN